MKHKMTMAQAFDEWMRKYKADPEGFENEMQSVHRHDKRKRSAKCTEYGHSCATLLESLMLNGKKHWTSKGE